MVDQSNYDVFPYDFSNDVGTITPYTPTNAEKRVDGLASLIRKIPGQDSNYWSRHTAQNFLKLIDPKQQGGIGEYLPGFSMDLARERNDPLGEALSYLDMIPGGGGALKGASVFLLARRVELDKLIKAVDTDPLLKGNKVLKQSYKKELDKVNKEITENARLKTQADEMIADPNKFGVSDDLDDVIREYINIDPKNLNDL